MTLNEIAAAHNVSLATIKRYKRAGVDITNAALVAAFKQAQRSRFAVSKLMSKSPVSAEVAPPADEIEQMKSDFWRVHMMIVAARDPLRDREPEVYARFQPILAITARWLDV
jgi:hypothetical protein